MVKHATTTDDEIMRSFLRPTLSIRAIVIPEPISWNIPVIIDAVMGWIDEPDTLKSFAVYWMIAPAPDIRCMVAKINDKTIAFFTICL